MLLRGVNQQMNYLEFVPVGSLGKRVRKAFVAGVLLATTSAAWQLIRDPAWDGWWDAFNWPQLFLYAPVLFFSGIVLWQLACFVAEYLYRRGKDNVVSESSQEEQKTLGFWFRDSSRICLLFVSTCVIGDIPMAANYLAVVRGWRWHWWWSNVVGVCLIVMLATWWVLSRIYE